MNLSARPGGGVPLLGATAGCRSGGCIGRGQSLVRPRGATMDSVMIENGRNEPTPQPSHPSRRSELLNLYELSDRYVQPASRQRRLLPCACTKHLCAGGSGRRFGTPRKAARRRRTVDDAVAALAARASRNVRLVARHAGTDRAVGAQSAMPNPSDVRLRREADQGGDRRWRLDRRPTVSRHDAAQCSTQEAT